MLKNLSESSGIEAFTKHLLKFIDKNLNNNYNEIEPYQLDHLIYGINIGDGSKSKELSWTRRTDTIFTGNLIFAENLQKLCIYNGFRCSLSNRISSEYGTTSYSLHIKPHKLDRSINFAKNNTRSKFAKETEFINEPVWCVSNKWQTIITRRNGKVAILGNCIGRSTRIKSQKFQEQFGENKAIILDFVDNTGKLSIMNAYELEKDMAIEDRMFLPKEHKEKLLLEIKERRERRINQQIGSDKKINLLVLPEFKVWNSEKMTEAATEKQIKWLQDIGLWVEDVEYTKAMASEIISNRPAAEWQVRWLAERKYDVSGGCTMGQYQRVKFLHDQRTKFAMDDKTKNKIINQLNNQSNE